MCPRGKIGRHKGLKILALLGVPVQSGKGPVLVMTKPLIISDKNLKSAQIKKQILKIFKETIFKKKYSHRNRWRWIYVKNFKKKQKNK